MPSGSSKDDISIRIGPNGRILEIDYVWPDVLTDVTLLHKFRLESKNADDKIENYHPIIIGFRNFFRTFRSKESEKISSTSKLRLPAEVETFITKVWLRWKIEKLALYRVLYVYLKCAEDTYVDQSDAESVEA